jgi:hypothetical protein
MFLTRIDGVFYMQDMSKKKAEIEEAARAEEAILDRVVEEAGRAVEEAVRDHKRAGNPIAEWRDGRVVLVPPERIED